MSTVEQTVRVDQPATPGNVIRAQAKEHLAAIDEFILGLQAATAAYRGRSVDWGDVASLKRVREDLSNAVEDLKSAAATAQLSRAAREVATQIRQFRAT